MSKILKDVATYSTKRILLDEISIENYVTTDNLLQNKQGKTTAEKMPKQASNSVTRFDEGDILIGNIRPYLKKIWLAKYTGGSSSDVLTFNVNINYNSAFVYYSLFRNDFFEHMMNGSKGTKMPRGDKNQILDFTIPDFELIKQKQIAKVLSDLDAKIEINNKINQQLEAMAKTLYDYWFVQFDFPSPSSSSGQAGKPYKSSGGKMVFNEALKREIPEGWEVENLEKVESKIITGKTPSTKNDDFYNGSIPFITIGDIRGNMHITETRQTLSELGANQNINKFLPKGSICVTCIASPGLVGFVTKDSQTNQQINSIICKKEENKFFLYFYLKDYFKFAKASSGSTFSNMNKGEFSSIKTIKPKKEILIDFSNKLESSINIILLNQLENQKLSELRDWLLPMLMNGQVTVGKEEK